MSKNNLKLWDSVEKTDPAHTKNAKIGQRNITAVAPQHQRKRATEVFGAYGTGWGIEDEHFSFIDFPDQTKLATYTATMWYVLDGNKGSFPITSNVKVAYVTNGGKGYLKIDDEFAKKAQTDALTKGLSFLGFNADVFMGLYDDHIYVNRMHEEFHCVSTEQAAELKQLCKDAGAEEAAFLAHYKAASFDKIDVNDYKKAKFILEERIKNPSS